MPPFSSLPLLSLLEEIVAGVYDHVTVTGVVHKLPVSGESVVGYIPGRGQVEGLFSNWGADTCEVSLCSKEHGDETGFANTSCPEKKEIYHLCEECSLLVEQLLGCIVVMLEGKNIRITSQDSN